MTRILLKRRELTHRLERPLLEEVPEGLEAPGGQLLRDHELVLVVGPEGLAQHG